MKRIILSACLILSMTGPTVGQSIGLVPQPGSAVPDLPPATPAPRADLVLAFREAARVFAATLVSDPPLAERVLSLNLDPKAAFALIRDEVQSLPYGGQLRGTEAVLAARSGNSHDKSAALADLLMRMGYDTRLVTLGTPITAPATCDGSAPGATPDAIRWDVTGLGAQVLWRTETRATASYAALRPLLAPQDAPATDTGPHVWVQMRDGADWVDLDPWSRANDWGAHPAGVGQLMTDLPAPQAVQITVTVERLQDGQLRRDDILSSRLDLPQAAGGLIALSFGPAVEGVGGAMANVLSTLEGGTGEMVANLMINDRTDKSAGFAAPGTVAVAAGFLADPAQSVTTGLWLTVTSFVPGAPDQSETRPIVDLVPAAVRLAAEGGTPVDPGVLTTALPGERFPAALESLRIFALSGGGMSPRVAAARNLLQLRDLPAALARANSGAPAPFDVIWAGFQEAQRISLAAEAVIAARPAHDGACNGILRPRVLIWGVAPAEGGTVVHWLDWVLDDPGVIGGDAVAQAEARLWHGVVAAGLEKEAFFHLTDADASGFPLDRGPMVARDTGPLGLEAVQDQARGFLTVADAGLPAAMWWRVDPATGRSDARFRSVGNGIVGVGAGAFLGPGSGVGASQGATWFISEAEEAALLAESEFGYDSLVEAALDQIEGTQAAERSRPRGGGDSNGYATLTLNVSIPASVGTGSGVSRGIVRVFRRTY